MDGESLKGVSVIMQNAVRKTHRKAVGLKRSLGESQNGLNRKMDCEHTFLKFDVGHDDAENNQEWYRGKIRVAGDSI
jgi:hypothetical protein